MFVIQGAEDVKQPGFIDNARIIKTNIESLRIALLFDLVENRIKNELLLGWKKAIRLLDIFEIWYPEVALVDSDQVHGVPTGLERW